jgi:hypothetical protein
METQRVLVIPKTEDKELDIYVSTQDPAHVQVRSKNTPSPTSSIPSWLSIPTVSQMVTILPTEI